MLYEEEIVRLPFAVEATVSGAVPAVEAFEIVNVAPLTAVIAVSAGTAYSGTLEVTVTRSPTLKVGVPETVYVIVVPARATDATKD